MIAKPKLAKPWLFFGAVFVWTWSFWAVAFFTGGNMDEAGAGLILLLVGVMGPTVCGIIFNQLTRDKAGRRDYWRRVAGFRYISWKWYLVIILFVPMMHIAAALIDNLMGGGGSTLGEAARGVVENPLSIIASIMFSTLIPFLEELGWRGYVLDLLQERRSSLTSSLILGAIWSIWHLPMFFIPGSYQNELGIGTTAFWLFFLAIIPLSIPFTWIYNNTNRCILSAILFHAMVNFTGELILLSKRADDIYNLLWFVAAFVIVAVWGGKTLGRRKACEAVALDR